MSRTAELRRKLVDVLYDGPADEYRVRAEFRKMHSESRADDLTIARYVKNRKPKSE